MTTRRPTGLVYSTELGRTCPECREPMGRCRCAQQRDQVLGDGNVRVRRETKGRNGKGVTMITGLPLNAADLAALATVLKKGCGSGGTVKDGVIEIQGDHRDALLVHVQSLGYRAKLAGG